MTKTDRSGAGSRAAILAAVRSSLSRDLARPRGSDAVKERLAGHPAGPRPARAQVSGARRIADFSERLVAGGAEVEALASSIDIPQFVARVLRMAGLEPCVRIGDDPYLGSLAWNVSGAAQALSGAATANDRASLSHGQAGISETGTIMLASGHENPGTLVFLPEVHFVALEVTDVVASFEEAFERTRHRDPVTRLPRALNLVSGPSRTGDIGGKLVRGAHGPRRLVVLLIGSALDQPRQTSS